MFNYLLSYLSDTYLKNKKMPSLTATIERNRERSWMDSMFNDNGTDKFKPDIKYVPSSGVNKIIYKN